MVAGSLGLAFAAGGGETDALPLWHAILELRLQTSSNYTLDRCSLRYSARAYLNFKARDYAHNPAPTNVNCLQQLRREHLQQRYTQACRKCSTIPQLQPLHCWVAAVAICEVSGVSEQVAVTRGHGLTISTAMHSALTFHVRASRSRLRRCVLLTVFLPLIV